MLFANTVLGLSTGDAPDSIVSSTPSPALAEQARAAQRAYERAFSAYSPSWARAPQGVRAYAFELVGPTKPAAAALLRLDVLGSDHRSRFFGDSSSLILSHQLVLNADGKLRGEDSMRGASLDSSNLVRSQWTLHCGENYVRGTWCAHHPEDDEPPYLVKGQDRGLVFNAQRAARQALSFQMAVCQMGASLFEGPIRTGFHLQWTGLEQREVLAAANLPSTLPGTGSDEVCLCIQFDEAPGRIPLNALRDRVHEVLTVTT